ncbi:MAG: mycodextranase [Caulobacter sp.]|nr:mycodextranase [Caulobacter sp.]
MKTAARNLIPGLMALAITGAAPSPTPVTIAGVDPVTVEGRGAAAAFTEYEAENAGFRGELLGYHRRFGTPAAEASGRRAVRLTAVGDYVEIVLAKPANAVTLRYALPDSASGKGLDSDIALYADGRRLGALALTSRYSWYYGRYPFTNRPADGGGHHIYDEARLLLPQMLSAGTRVRFQVERADVAWRLIDLADFEVATPTLSGADGAVSVLAHGADPSGRRESSRAFDAAIARSQTSGKRVWIPPGRYRIDRHIIVDEVSLAGAGPWFTVLTGRGVGIYGRKAPQGSRNVILRDFAIFGEVTGRDDHAQVNGVGGAMSDSEIFNLWIQHTKVGLWFDGPMSNLRLRDLRILSQAADGLNFHRGVTDASVANSFVRGTGDDGIAAWSHRQENARIQVVGNTVIAPTLANGIALYGGRDLTIRGNLVADAVTQGGGYHLGQRFDATPFGPNIRLTDNTALRSGTWDPNWRFGVGAFWIYALDRPIQGRDLIVEGLDLRDNDQEGLLFMGQPIDGLTLNGVHIDGSSHAITLRADGSATFSGLRLTRTAEPAIRVCNPKFLLIVEGSPPPTQGGCP